MSTPPGRPGLYLFDRGSWPEVSRIGDILRTETVGGALLAGAAVIALVWANSPWGDAYATLSGLRLGPAALHWDLTLAQWAADGLLAIFFFVAGLELKREFVAGDLHDPRRAALPVAAAVGGMASPAIIYLAFNASSGNGALAGWAIPTATDIAFALAVLAVIGTHLPAALRMFLLTLAVVDDLLAITIIAVFYTSSLQLAPLALALIPLGVFALVVQRRVRSWWLLLPLGAVTWVLVHESGVHATVAGVLLGFTVPVIRRVEGPGPGLAEHFEHRFRPISAGVAVPVFAFFAAGVSIAGAGGLGASLSDSVTLGIIAALVVGKLAGVVGATWFVQRFTRAQLAAGLSWWDVLGIALLAGIGFTVSLLIGELAFGAGSERDDHVKIGVLLGSLLSALLATVVLRIRNHHYRRICANSGDLKPLTSTAYCRHVEEVAVAVVDNAVYVQGRRTAEPETLDHAIEVLRDCSGDGPSFCWIGMLRPTPQEITEVAQEFNLHPLAVEDAVDAHQRSKLERYGDTRFVVLRPARYVDPVEIVEINELHLFLGPEFVVTVRHADLPDLTVVRKRMEDQPELLRHGPDAVLYAVMDKVVDDYVPVLDGLQDDIDEIETQVFTGDPDVSRRIYQLTREVIEFQRAVEPLSEILDEILSKFSEREGEPELDLELRRAFRDVQDHAARVSERTDSFRQLLNHALTANSTQVAQRQNEEITRLTEATYKQNEQVKQISAYAAILFAPTLVGTVYGMNFTHMPELKWVLGYPFAVALMILTALVLRFMFKRRGWL